MTKIVFPTSSFLTIFFSDKNFSIFSKIIHVLNIIVQFFLPVPKIKFDPPPQEKNALVFIF